MDFYTALAGGTNEFQKYLDGFALTTDILAEIDPTVKVNPIDPSAQIRAALSGKTTTAHVGTTVIPDFLYENNELDTTQLGDGKNVISVAAVLVKPSYMYSTCGFNSALLTPNNLTVSPNVTVSAKYTVDTVSNVLKTTLGAEAAGGIPYELKWNTTGEVCVEWELADLMALAFAIDEGVTKLVEYQQTKEIEIRNAATIEELNAIEVDYDTVQ